MDPLINKQPFHQVKNSVEAVFEDGDEDLMWSHIWVAFVPILGFSLRKDRGTFLTREDLWQAEERGKGR